MKFLSVCSGIEAASVAWHPLGWQSVAYSEIEPFPCQVLKHHYPTVPNLGDMTKFKEWNLESNVDVFVGGTPCQSFSVAGLRKGLDDPRGNLMLVFLAIAKQYRPNWLVWENVPGVLSSADGRDFGSFLGGLAILGYGFAYRVLDAQYFGVAQRRRRVFVVGYFGNWRPAAAVLFERESLSGHPAPSREKREDIANCLTKSPSSHSSFNPARSEGNAVIALAENTIGRKPENGGNGDGFTDGGPMYTLNATGVHGVAQPIAFDAYNQTTSDTVTALRCAAGGVFDNTVAQPIAFSRNDDGGDATNDLAPTMRVAGNAGGMLAAAMAVAQPVYELHSQDSRVRELGDVCTTVSATYGAGGGNVPITLMPAMAVRRLTPVECERLQGFPDRYTDIQPKGKPTPDGPRYKALGNSMAVPVMAWIGKRIQEVDALL